MFFLVDIYHSFTMWDAKAYDKGADTRSWWSMIDLFESMSQGIEYSNSGNSSNSNSSTDASDDEEVLEELDYGDVFVSSAHTHLLSGIIVVLTSLFTTIVEYIN